MGFWSDVLKQVQHRIFSPSVTYLGMTPDGYAAGGLLLDGDASRESVLALWRHQPHLRTVVSFRARNVAHLGLHCYRRTEAGRERDRTSPMARVLADVDGVMTTYDLVYAISGDLDLFDRCYLLLVQTDRAPSGWQLRRIPPTWVSEVWDGGRIIRYDVAGLHEDRAQNIPPESMIRLVGYSPGSNTESSPAIESLRGTLREQIESAEYRRQVWDRGGRVSAVLQRPQGAPQWSDAAREAFRADWYAKYTGTGPLAGGTPLLEDGMTLQRVDFSASDQQYVEAAKLSLQTVAAAFHVQPTMVGQGDGATYSNIRAFRKMLYTETLGPTLAQIEARLSRDMGRILGLDDSYYVEFNLQEKLQGDFEEQAAVLSSSVGGPWMTRNEARARMNLPALSAADDLIVPLNVITGGQASPHDSGSQNQTPNAPDRATSAHPRVKLPHSSDDTPDATALAAERLAKFFKRQGRSVLSSRTWDSERWSKELGADLMSMMRTLSVESARQALLDAGLDPDAYDVARTVKFLRAAADRRAQAITDAMGGEWDSLVADDEADESEMFSEDAVGNRAEKVATSVVAFATSFGPVEAGRQTGAATKTWVVTSGNPRASHARMDGETVGIDDEFSNGLSWPGAFGDADEVAGCTCEAVVNW